MTDAALPAPHRIDAPDVALVFEGGGMRNSYTAAALDLLLAEGVRTGWVGGISAGSTHTANYLAGDRIRVRQAFVDFARDPNFGGWKSFLRGRGFFDAEYIYEISPAPGHVGEYDFDAYRENPIRARIGAVRADTGEMVYWDRDDMDSLSSLMRRVRASSTMPGLMPMPEIDGVPYVDGALGPSGGIPLDAAEDDGFDRFLVLMTRERDYVKKPVRYPGLIRTHFRRYPAIAERLIARAENYNRTRERLFELERQGRAMLFFPDRMPVESQTRDVAKLAASFDEGLTQAEREWPRWREFLQG